MSNIFCKYCYKLELGHEDHTSMQEGGSLFFVNSRATTTINIAKTNSLA